MAKKTIHDLKEEYVENEIESEVEADEVDPGNTHSERYQEVVEEVKVPVQSTIFRTLKEAKSYAIANGGKVKEKGKFFYVR